MGLCFTRPAVKGELEGQLPVKTKKVAFKKAPVNTVDRHPAAKQGAPIATLPCCSSKQASSKLGVCYNIHSLAAAALTTKIDASTVAPAQEAVSLVLLEEGSAKASRTTARGAVGGHLVDILPGSLQEKPAPPQPKSKPSIREVQCQDNIDDLLDQLAVVDARKQRVKAEGEHVSTTDEADITRQLNAGKKQKAWLQRALKKAHAELALARIDRLPELPEDFMELRTLGKGSWGEVLEVACTDSIGELHNYALKKALVPASAAAAPAEAAAAEPAARAAASFRGASAKAAPAESGALELPGAGRCSGKEGVAEEDPGEEASSEAAREAADEVGPAGVEEVELWNTREAAGHLTISSGACDARQALQTEGAFLSLIGPHHGIISCHGWVGRDRSALLLELAPFGSLDSCLWGKKHSRLRWTAAEKLRMSLQCVRGARHIHAAGAVHRDIKPQNTLMVERTDARLADFGMACWASEAGRCRGLAGSVAYSINPLSVEDFSAAGIQDDTWAIGLLIWCLYTRRDICTLQGYQMIALEKCEARREDLQRMQARCRELGLPEGHYSYELLVAQALGLAGLDAPGMQDNPLAKPRPGEPTMPERFTRMLPRATSVESWREQPVTLQQWEECLVSCLRETEEAEAKARMGCGIRWRF